MAKQRPHDPRPSLEAVAAVVVTYHPDSGLTERLRRLENQVADVVVIDNGSSLDELSQVHTLVEEGVINAIYNEQNLGVGVALNQGAAWAAARGFPWFLTLDQDTTPGPEVIGEAARGFEEAVVSPAVIGAGYLDGSKVDTTCGDRASRPVACVITAGALHSTAIWQQLGGFREDFFVDYVDTEYCLRARAAGYAVLRTCRPTITHVIGLPTRHSVGVRSLTPSNHSRIRRYYITRNRIIVWSSYFQREPQYIRTDLKAFVKEFVKLVLFESDRTGKLWAIARGAYDGLRGATGPARMRADGNGG